MFARLSKKGQITIPKKIREILNIEKEGSVLFVVEGNEVKLKGIPAARIEDVAGCLKKYAKEYVDLETIREKIGDEIAEEIAQEGLDFPIVEETVQEGNKIKYKKS